MLKPIVASRKGSVGKSTTAVHLAAALALANVRTLLVDTDGQGNSARMLGVTPESGLSEVLEGNVPIEKAMIQPRPTLFLLSGSKALAGFARIIARQQFDWQHVLSQALQPIDGTFDFVVVDTAPGFGELSINALFYGTEILVPVSMEVLAVYGFVDFLAELEPIRKRSRIEIKYVLPTMPDHRKGLTEDVFKQLQERFPKQYYEPIPYMTHIGQLAREGKTIFEVNTEAKQSVAYAKLYRRILENGAA